VVVFGGVDALQVQVPELRAINAFDVDELQ
jgi:hypothetical protein